MGCVKEDWEEREEEEVWASSWIGVVCIERSYYVNKNLLHTKTCETKGGRKNPST